jgi:hypothetical protein
MEGWRKDARHEPIIVDLDALVPKGHLLRKIEKVMDYEWLYERLNPYYCHDNGRPGTDPVVLIKMVLIQHLFGIARAHDAHVQGEHEEIVAEHVEHAAEQHRLGGQGRVAVVAQKRRHQLGEQEAGHHKLDGEQIRPGQRQQGLLRAEQRQELAVKENQRRPGEKGQDRRCQDCRREILVGALFVAGA